MIQRTTEKFVKTRHLRTEVVINDVQFSIGDLIKVKGMQGRYEIREIRDDGAFTCYGGTKGHLMYRTFVFDRVSHASRK